MKIILLSGGSGKRLWPLSNNTRSKQFLRVLTAPDGTKESMIQRVVRQIKSVGFTDDIVVATGQSQKDSIENQLGGKLQVVTEPCRRDTFSAILLACSYLASNGTPMDEPIIVMPCDSFADDSYFKVIGKMAHAVKDGVAELVLMGIKPTYPSAKYGYIVPEKLTDNTIATPVKRFTEKPDVPTAEKLLQEGALWNGGVFAFRLGYLMDIAKTVTPDVNFNDIRNTYDKLPKISFDYAVVEKAESVAVIPYSGEWKDLGTWNTLTDELQDYVHGDVYAEDSNNTYIINELDIPIVSIGIEDAVIAASPDGILVTKRKLSENLKHIVDKIGNRPMYEERRWGEYWVLDMNKFSDGACSLTKRITIRPGKSISYQRHKYRDEIWTIIDGEGEVVLDGDVLPVRRGDVIKIKAGQLHLARAKSHSLLSFTEVQQGYILEEEDIERLPLDV